MRVEELFRTVQLRADDAQAQIILDAMDLLAEQILKTSKEFETIKCKSDKSSTRQQNKLQYEAALQAYSFCKIQLHHLYKWFRDGQNYSQQSLQDDYKYVEKLTTRYHDLYRQMCILRDKKNKAMLLVYPEEAQKKINRGKSIRSVKEYPPLRII
ncbi:MAG: hypothetical protein ACP5N7_06690 [Candidatus Pacearchaeota archaeon]